MISVFTPVKELLKVDDVRIDTNIFRLHYKATTILLIAFSLIISSRQFVGDPIDCLSDHENDEFVDTFCWMHSTFTFDKIGEETWFGPYEEGKDKIIVHKYYQFVWFVLIVQAILFYVPHYLWKAWEDGRMKMLVADLNSPILSDGSREHQKLLVDYFHTNLHTHNCYAYRFFFCELLNFVNVVGQIFFVDLFLGGEFSTYGSDVIAFTDQDPHDRSDPMTRVFPTIAKCIIKYVGPSSSVQKIDAICQLPLNVVNEKIYVFMWFWFILLAILSGLGLAYRAAILASPKLRLFLLRAQAGLSSTRDIDFIAESKYIGDWFLLYQLGHNIDLFIYKKLLDNIKAAFSGERIEYEP